MRKFLSNWGARLVAMALAGVACVAIPALAFADGGVDYSAVTTQFGGVATAMTAGAVAAITAAILIGALIKGAPVIWRTFWKFAK